MMTDAPIKKRSPNRQNDQPVTNTNIIPKQQQKQQYSNNPPIQYIKKVTPNPNENDARVKRDMLFLRKQKIKEMLDEETEEYKFEMVSRQRSNYSQLNDQSINMKPQSSSSSSVYNPQPQPNSSDRPISSSMHNNAITNTNPMHRDYSNSYFPEPKPNYYSKNQYSKPITDPFSYDNGNMSNNNQMKYSKFEVNKELDFAIKKYADNLDKLKVDEFMSRKKIQDDLLKKINSKLAKINHEMNDKIYQENLADQWASKYSHQPDSNTNSNNPNSTS